MDVTIEQTPTLQMRSDRNTLDSNFQEHVDMFKQLRQVTSDGTEHSIKDFLARPKMLDAFDWANTSAAGTYLFGVDLPSRVIVDRIYASKVAGFAFFRATVVVRLMINTQRFQCGRMLLSWMPLCKQNTTKYNDTKYLVYATQRPRAEFDVSTDTEVVMHIPFVHSAMAFDLTTGANDAGRLDFMVYSPLSSGTVKCNVYYSFEDIELSYAVEPGTFIAQSGGGVKTSKRGRNGDPGDAEAKAMGVRPVSSMLASLATTARYGASIPLISSVAGPVSWAAGLAAKAAHAFGYSKPLMLAPRMRMVYQSDTHRLNCDGAHMAANLGVFEDNKIRHLPGFAGSDLDEMAISNIIGTYAYCGVATWTTSSLENAALFNNQVTSPINVGATTRTLTVAGNTAATVRDTTPLSYVAALFLLYRGSLKLKFKVVKTEFHSGRLRFQYFLRSDYTTSGFPAAFSANVHSTIFDLRDSTEFEVIIPFGAVTNYLPVSNDFARWNLKVETPLVAAGDAPTSIQILVEMAAHDDFEFAAPLPIARTPCTTAFTQIGAQMAISNESETQQTLGDPATPAGGAKVTNDGLLPAESCIGEKILSFRQLLKRHTRCLKIVRQQATSGIGTWYATPSFSFSPWSVVLPSPIQPTNFRGNANTSVWWQPDYFTYVGVMFAMHRGSVRIADRPGYFPTVTFDNTVIERDQSSSGTLRSLEYLDQGFGYSYAPIVGTSSVGCLTATIYEDVQVPYYNRAPSHLTPIGPWAIGNQATPAYNPGPTTCLEPNIGINYSGSQASSTLSEDYSYISVSRAIGEDFSMGYFTGTYPTVAIDTSQAYRNVA